MAGGKAPLNLNHTVQFSAAFTFIFFCFLYFSSSSNFSSSGLRGALLRLAKFRR